MGTEGERDAGAHAVVVTSLAKRIGRPPPYALACLVMLVQARVSSAQESIPSLPSSAALLPPGSKTLSEFVPASDQRPTQLPASHVAGDGFYPAASSSFKLFDETLNANGGKGQDWGQDGKELAATVAQDFVRLGPFDAIHRFGAYVFLLSSHAPGPRHSLALIFRPVPPTPTGTMAPRRATAFANCDGEEKAKTSPTDREGVMGVGYAGWEVGFGER